MQTWPSREEVAMNIALLGVLGSGACWVRGVRGLEVLVLVRGNGMEVAVGTLSVPREV